MTATPLSQEVAVLRVQAQVLGARGEAAAQVLRLAPRVRWAQRWVPPTQPVARAWQGLAVEVWSAASRRAAPVWAAAGSWAALAASPARGVWAAVAVVVLLG